MGSHALHNGRAPHSVNPMVKTFSSRTQSISSTEMLSSSNVAEFYRGRSVFITGATGFMGKVLVEKLLRSCPGLESVYLLIRSNPKKDSQARLKELIDNKVNVYPNFYYFFFVTSVEICVQSL